MIEDECVEDANGVRHHLHPSPASKAAAILPTAYLPDEGLCAEPVGPRESALTIPCTMFSLEGPEMKLAIGLIVMVQFALAQGPAPAPRPCDRAPAMRPNGAPPAPRGALLPRATQHRPRTSRESQLPGAPCLASGSGRWRLLHRARLRASARTNQTCRQAGVPEGKVVQLTSIRRRASTIPALTGFFQRPVCVYVPTICPQAPRHRSSFGGCLWDNRGLPPFLTTYCPAPAPRDGRRDDSKWRR